MYVLKMLRGDFLKVIGTEAFVRFTFLHDHFDFDRDEVRELIDLLQIWLGDRRSTDRTPDNTFFCHWPSDCARQNWLTRRNPDLLRAIEKTISDFRTSKIGGGQEHG